jgi:hypothetical protein
MMTISGMNGLNPIGDAAALFANNSTATVRLGETTLNDVARRLGVDANCLRQANPLLSETASLKAGQELSLPKLQAGSSADLDNQRGPNSNSTLPRHPIGDPLASAAMKGLLNQFGLGDFGNSAVHQHRRRHHHDPIDIDRVSFRRHREPINVDRLTLRHWHEPVNADKISFNHWNKSPLNVDTMSFGNSTWSKALDPDKISFRTRFEPFDADTISFGDGDED